MIPNLPEPPIQAVIEPEDIEEYEPKMGKLIRIDIEDEPIPSAAHGDDAAEDV